MIRPQFPRPIAPGVCRSFGAISAIAGFIISGIAVTQGDADAAPSSVESRELQASLDSFGFNPPENGAELFAPDVVSRPDRFEARIAFSPDLRECYLTETDATFSRPRLLVARRGSDGWSAFEAVGFGAAFAVCHEPFVSDDNQRLYFTADGRDRATGDARDFWVVERTESGWGEPARLAEPVNSNAVEFYFNQSSDGTIIFTSNRPGGYGDFDLYQVETDPEGLVRAVNLGAPCNTPGPEFDPCLSTDGRLLVFASAQHGEPHLDIYMSSRDSRGVWAKPVPVRGDVNTAANEYAPTFSRDGRCLFFVRHDGKQSDVFWVATDQIGEMQTGDRSRP